MKTTVVSSSELGQDWTPGAHMPRVLTAAAHVEAGDKIGVRDHRTPEEGDRRWHLVTVLGTEKDRSIVTLMTNRWPIVYVCSADELVELVEITRTVRFRCAQCHRDNDPRLPQTTVTLDDFVDTSLMKRLGQHVVILPDTATRVQGGFCKEHGTTFLA